jgi:hypothetical protein
LQVGRQLENLEMEEGSEITFTTTDAEGNVQSVTGVV